LVIDIVPIIEYSSIQNRNKYLVRKNSMKAFKYTKKKQEHFILHHEQGWCESLNHEQEDVVASPTICTNEPHV
jgi:hypothetical protein